MVLRLGWNQYTVALHVSKPLHNLNNHSGTDGWSDLESNQEIKWNFKQSVKVVHSKSKSSFDDRFALTWNCDKKRKSSTTPYNQQQSLSPLVLNAIKLDHKDAEPLPLVIRFKNAWFYLSVEQYFPKFWNGSKKVTHVILHQLTFTFDLLTRIVNTKWPQFASCCWAKGAHSLFRTCPMLQLRMSARQRLLSALNLPISNSCFIKCLIIKVTDD